MYTTEISNEDEVLLEELGALALEGALAEYLSTAEESQAEEFSSYIEAHVADDDFLPRLGEVFPAFAGLLAAETAVLQSEWQEIVKSVE